MSKHPPDHGRALAGMFAAMVLAIFTVFSATAITHGFLSYYVASRLLVSGELGPLILFRPPTVRPSRLPFRR